ncbi:MAG: ATP-grasp domain-containing protein [Bdellovibrionales bacterium]|nr:ATP-grasp domain-containing protein [Bdellovibrionales bacterium]
MKKVISSSSHQKIGVLGGGQLALFLSLKAQKLGLDLYTLSSLQKSSSLLTNRISSFQIEGNPHDRKDLKKFFKKIDILTFESEFFSAELIQSLNPVIDINPSLKNLKNIQDRYLQKKLLIQNSFPVLDFVVWNHLKGKENYRIPLNFWKKWGAFVLKTRRGGYDGYGTFLVKKKQDIFKLPAGSFILEPFINFDRELAILVARNQKGQIVFFPLVESFQKNSVCLWVKGPIKHKRINSFKKKIQSFLSQIDYRGVIAFELFEKNSNLIVNELAPRVHNTGHYSLDALTQDQFSMHLKAISNQDLKSPRLKTKSFAMLNLLGKGHSFPCFKKQSLLKCKEQLKKQAVSLYWYGKTESRLGRKMGHLNCIEGDQALNKLLKIERHIKV